MKQGNDKIKLLMVVMDFYQAGAPRFAYEVDRAINKSIFNIAILCAKDLNANPDFEDYYYSKHLELGSTVFFLNDVFKDISILAKSVKKLIFNRFTYKILPKSINRRLLTLIAENKKKRKRLSYFLSRFEVISWMGEYTFSSFIKYIDDTVYNKSVIHLMAAKFQSIHVFNVYPKNKNYILTSGYSSDEAEYELSDLTNFENIFFPLSIEINQNKCKWQFRADKKKKKIGIFTRLDAITKPLDTFFAAFHLLLDVLPRVELHIFGAGDPVATGMKSLTNNFNISNAVFFRGHQKDIVETANEEMLDLVWFQGYKNRPAGYAGFDISTTGIPQIFWDFSDTFSDTESMNIVYPNYKKLQDFVYASLELLTNEEKASILSKMQFDDLAKSRNIKKNIQILENVFFDITKNSRINFNRSS